MLTLAEKILFVLATLVSLYFTYKGVQRILKSIASGHDKVACPLIQKRIG